jgi:hypothetical protein
VFTRTVAYEGELRGGDRILFERICVEFLEPAHQLAHIHTVELKDGQALDELRRKYVPAPRISRLQALPSAPPDDSE